MTKENENPPTCLMPTRFQDSSQIKTREVYTFSSCLSIVCLLLTFSWTSSIFFINFPVFHFLDLKRIILNLVYSYLKIQRKDQNVGRYSVFFLTPPPLISVSTHNTVQLGWDNIEINNQNKCCHKGAKKVKIPNIQR